MKTLTLSQESLESGCVFVMFLFFLDTISSRTKVSNLLFYSDRKHCAILFLSGNVPMTCEKCQPLEFLLKIDLWQHVAKDASVQFITQGVFQPQQMEQCSGTAIVRSQDLCVFWADPTSLTPESCIRYCQKRWVHFRSLRPDLTALANLLTSGRVAWGRIASGGKNTQLLFLSVSIMWDLQSCSASFASIKNTAAAPSRLWKRVLSNISVNRKRPCDVMMMSVIIGGHTPQPWMVTVKSPFALFAFEQLNITSLYLLSCMTYSWRIRVTLKSLRWYMDLQVGCRTVLTFYYWLIEPWMLF